MFNNPLNANPNTGQVYQHPQPQQTETLENRSVLKFINGHYNNAMDTSDQDNTYSESDLNTVKVDSEPQAETFLGQVWEQFLDLFTEEDADPRSPVGIGRLNDINAQTFAPSFTTDSTEVTPSTSQEHVYRRNHQTPDFRFQQLIAKTRNTDQSDVPPQQAATISSAAGWDSPPTEPTNTPTTPMPRIKPSNQWESLSDTPIESTPAPTNPFQRIDFKPAKQDFPKIQNAWKQ